MHDAIRFLESNTRFSYLQQKSSIVSNVSFNNKPFSYARKFIDLLLLSNGKGKNSALFRDILSFVNTEEYEYQITYKTALTGLPLATELVKISEKVISYPSVDNTLTFELLFNNGRATVVHGEKNSLVVSDGEKIDWGIFSNDLSDVDNLIKKINQIVKN